MVVELAERWLDPKDVEDVADAHPSHRQQAVKPEHQEPVLVDELGRDRRLYLITGEELTALAVPRGRDEILPVRGREFLEGLGERRLSRSVQGVDIKASPQEMEAELRRLVVVVRGLSGGANAPLEGGGRLPRCFELDISRGTRSIPRAPAVGC